LFRTPKNYLLLFVDMEESSQVLASDQSPLKKGDSSPKKDEKVPAKLMGRVTRAINNNKNKNLSKGGARTRLHAILKKSCLKR
jgi:hypothetical protein